MKLANIERYIDHHRTAELEGLEPQLIPDGYPSARKSFQPNEISMSWHGGEKPKDAAVTGIVLRKDGTPRNRAIVISYRLGTAPAWVKELAAELHHV